MDIKPEWLRRLKQIDSNADLRWNGAVHRWEFLLTCADGVVRSQFWCRFDATRRESSLDPVTGKKVVEEVPDRDPVTGMMPFRPLNDHEFAIALRNLTSSFVGRRGGPGTIRRDVLQRYRYNRDLREQRYQQRGQEYAEYIWDHRRQIRDAGAGPLISVAQEVR